jgi:hypothetical protein
MPLDRRRLNNPGLTHVVKVNHSIMLKCDFEGCLKNLVKILMPMCFAYQYTLPHCIDPRQRW